MDDTTGSLFAQSVINVISDEEKYMESWKLFEHCNHLLYLFAYGTSLDWHEIWEELLFIKAKSDDTQFHEALEPIFGYVNTCRKMH